MRVYVNGATGVVGKRVVPLLVAQGVIPSLGRVYDPDVEGWPAMLAQMWRA